MFRHHLILLYRNIARFKATFLINMIGLSTAITGVLLIFLWVADELNKDRFHKKDEQLYQVFEIQNYQNSRNATNSTPWLLAETLKAEMPEVEFAVTESLSEWFEPFTLTANDKNIKARGRYVGGDFFEMFSYPLVAGQPHQVLQNNVSIVISDEVATNLFGTGVDPMGKTISFQHNKEFTVSGVFRNVPESSNQFDFVLSYKILIEEHPQVTEWKNAGPSTYVVLKNGTDLDAFNAKIKNLIATKSDITHRELFATRYSDLYLNGRFENGVQAGGRIEYVILFSSIAAFILLIACINFMNLSTARASRRVKEVGIKKTVGAGRGNLVIQFLTESMAITSLSLLLAILLVDLMLPTFNTITGKNLTLEFNRSSIVSATSLLAITGLLAGSYPALYLSRFKPAAILKGMLVNTTGELWIRRGLVVFQFTLSIILIGVVLVIQNQIQFVINKNLGYEKDNLLYFEMEGELMKRRETFLIELRKIPGVEQASAMAQSMVGGGNTTSIEWEGKDPNTIISFAIRPVDYGAVDMLGLSFIEGRSFSEKHADSLGVILNKAAIEIMGIEDPVEKTISLGPFDSRIIGVVEDFNFESLHSGVGPMFFMLAPQHTSKIVVRIHPDNPVGTIDMIEKLYSSFNPGFIFSYRFMDQDYENQYRSETRVATLSRYFAGIAILISCLGLFGLAAFTAERRQKEIGIRKALGASEINIVMLISGDFTRLVLIAVLLAVPFGYYAATTWLNNFTYKIELSWFYFFGAGIIALAIAWATISSHALRSARINPAKCLKSE